MTPPIPPARAAHLFAHEQGETQQDAQRSFLRSLALFADTPVNFHGNCNGCIWCESSNDISTCLAFATDRGSGVIEITLADSGWLRADLIASGVPVLRAWIEDPYEEKEFWPDGADGVGEAPSRISKRGAWLTIDCARFPGVPPNANGYWQVEETA